MSRPSVGNLPQGASHSALAAHVASTLARVGTGRAARDRWLEEQLGLTIRSNGLERAASLCGDHLRPWLLVAKEATGTSVETTLVVFPGQGQGRPGLLAKLYGTGAVRQLLVTRSRRDVLCVLLHPAADRQRLFEQLDSLGEPMAWEEILEEDREIESIAWQTLAKQLGVAEGFA